MTITGSTISGNTAARHGGGILVGDNAAPTITNSTISGNVGGGVYELGSGTTLTHVTVAGNDTGVTNARTIQSSFMVRNSILSNTGPNCALGTITSGGYNLVSDVSCGFAGGGTDQVNTPANLGPLALNGGPTKTHALLAPSPVIDVIPTIGGCNNASVTTDQRGIARPAGIGCDIGAYESAQAPNPSPKPAGPSAPSAPNPVPQPKPGGQPAPGPAAPAPIPQHR